VWVVVGLGNPGPGYATHRHNVGAMAVEELARRGGGAWKSHRLLKVDATEVRVGPLGAGSVGADARRVICARTKTYMNESGIPVKNLLTHEKTTPQRLIVIHDELDLDLGRIRAKFGGGDNGHNGLKSIRARLGTGDYYRVRIGIGRPEGHQEVYDWVLSGFPKAQKDDVSALVDRAADAVESLIVHGLEQTQQSFNS
jgi:PTH1 family peptidyl-tRNA hydrolase